MGEMENRTNNSDIEYFKKFVNSGHEGLAFSEKSNVFFLFFFLPIIGIILSLFWLDSVALRIAFLIVMVGGMVSTLASDKWFPQNKGYLFRAWLGVAGTGVICFLIGLVVGYGLSNLLILIFIIVHAVIAVLTLNRIVRRISSRHIPEEKGRDRQKKELYYSLAGCFFIILAYAICSQVTEGLAKDIKNVILAAVFMSISTIIWLRTQRLFQLYYAVKYNIDVVNAWDKRRGSPGFKEDYPCPLFGKTIEESLCIKINYENEEIMKQDKINEVKEQLNMTSDEIKQVCKSCKCYPFKS